MNGGEKAVGYARLGCSIVSIVCTHLVREAEDRECIKEVLPCCWRTRAGGEGGEEGGEERGRGLARQEHTTYHLDLNISGTTDGCQSIKTKLQNFSPAQ